MQNNEYVGISLNLFFFLKSQQDAFQISIKPETLDYRPSSLTLDYRPGSPALVFPPTTSLMENEQFVINLLDEVDWDKASLNYTDVHICSFILTTFFSLCLCLFEKLNVFHLWHLYGLWNPLSKQPLWWTEYVITQLEICNIG